MFFYMKNSGDEDLINLPPFQLAPPNDQYEWGYDPKEMILEINAIHKLVEEFKKEKQLTGDDLLWNFTSLRVCPLQTRVHKICHMSGCYDPIWVSNNELTKDQVRDRVKAIAKMSMDNDWEWGVEPYDRNHLPPNVSHLLPNPTYLSCRGSFYVGKHFALVLTPPCHVGLTEVFLATNRGWRRPIHQLGC